MKTISLLISAVFDLLVCYFPQTKKRDGFAFLVHPRDISDVYKKYPFLKYFSNKIIATILLYFWPIVVSEVNGVKERKTGKKIKGWVISIPITAEQMMNNRDVSRKFIIKACKLAERKGAALIGLGALNASLSRGGMDILPFVSSGVITGRMYTAKVIIDTVESVVKRLGLDKENIEIAIVGAAGSIGTACAQLLAQKGFYKILLIDLSNKNGRIYKLEEKIKSINSNISVKISHDISSIKKSDIIIAVTNKPDALIRSENLKSGAIIVDDAQPSDVDTDIIFKRNDVLVLEGGVAHLKGINANFNFGLKHKEDVFSCLAETIILASIGYRGNFQVGEIFKLDNEAFRMIEQRSSEMGFKIGEFQNFHKVYSNKEIKKFKALHNHKKK
jgi:predicted amino acid dehydrogenase